MLVLVARPGRELRWFGRIWLPRVFDAVHYFRLEHAGDGTRLVQGESVQGVALWLFDLAGLARSFEQVNLELKQRAETPAQ